MAESVTRHRLFLSDVCLEIESRSPAVDRYLARQWAAAKEPLMDTRRRHRVTVHDRESTEICYDEEVVWHGTASEDAVNAFELTLYRRMLIDHSDRFGVFHGALVSLNDTVLVLCGPSTAGKSSLALSAIRRGGRYLTDEFVVTDGRRVWGWPRALRFDSGDGTSARPPWLAGLRPDGESGSYYADVDQHVGQAADASAVHFVQIEHGSTTRLDAVAPAFALRYWIEACFFPTPVSMGALATNGQCWRAVWDEPSALLDLLEEATSPPRQRAAGMVETAAQ